MTAALLYLAWLTPLAALAPALSSAGRWWMPAAALPALAAALMVPAGAYEDVSWLLLGVRLGLDPTGQIFLAFTAFLWLTAGFHAALNMQADPHTTRFRLYFLLAMSGNFGLIVAQDLIGFYAGFALMGLAAYGLVVHEGNDWVRRAGRVYLVMTLLGEVALFAGFLLLFSRTGTLTPAVGEIAGAGPVELGLLLIAFGIKAGLIGLHMWLPLAHPAAPVAASAVLSGAMIKSALIGWLRYLPLGQQALPELGIILVLTGVAGALAAIPFALIQRDPKVVLAYSSVGKMGTMIAGLGIAVMEPALAPGLIGALAIYAAHHGLVKGALFLGVGVGKGTVRRWPLLVLVLLALVLAGAPFTSGALAKDLLKQALLEPSIWVLLLVWMLPLTAAGTGLVMARFLYLMHRVRGSASVVTASAALPWLALAVTSLSVPLIYGAVVYDLSSMLPIMVAAVLAGAVGWSRRSPLARWIGMVPPGDILNPLMRLLGRLGAGFLGFGTSCRAVLLSTRVGGWRGSSFWRRVTLR
jgi:formate hydrogenlyase subunit 3/multisubunit Na+/H+ antiporter MnhD subunit